MITKIKINKNTLEVSINNDFSVNYIKDENDIIELEISRPDPEVIYPYTNPTT
jgi:hypothetical protein